MVSARCSGWPYDSSAGRMHELAESEEAELSLASADGQARRSDQEAFPGGFSSGTSESSSSSGPHRRPRVDLHRWVISELSVPSHQLWESVISHKRRLHMPYEFSAGFPFPSVEFLRKAAETRHTGLGLPEPYVIEAGHETAWMLNVHVLDTRGAVSSMGCVECRCDLYNATTDELDGQPLPEGYIGGLQCCGVGQQCALREGFNGEARTFHLRYHTYPCHLLSCAHEFFARLASKPSEYSGSGNFNECQVVFRIQFHLQKVTVGHGNNSFLRN